MLFDHFQESDYENWATIGLLISDFEVPVTYNSNMVDMWISTVEQFYHHIMHVEVQCQNLAVNMVIKLWVILKWALLDHLGDYELFKKNSAWRQQ